jgi:hypothetical protein
MEKAKHRLVNEKEKEEREEDVRTGRTKVDKATGRDRQKDR